MADTKLQMLNDNKNDQCNVITVLTDTSQAFVHNSLSF